MIEDALRVDLRQFLARHNALTLAYSDDNGVGACGLWYAADDDLTCYFLSSLSTRHGLALQAGGDVAFAIHKDEQDWRTIQGVQGRGQCVLVSETRTMHAWQAYTQRFPFVLQRFTALDAALQTARLWQIRPTWLRLIDNAKGLGHQQEITLG